MEMLGEMPQWLALVLSIACESAAASATSIGLGSGRPERAALAAALGTLATHWLAWRSAAPLGAAIGHWPAFVAIEAAVTLIESLGYRILLRTSWTRSLLVSLVANASSGALGLVLDAARLM